METIKCELYEAKEGAGEQIAIFAPTPPINEGAVAQQGRDPLGETPKFNVVNFEWELLLSLVTIKTWWRGIFQRL